MSAPDVVEVANKKNRVRKPRKVVYYYDSDSTSDDCGTARVPTDEDSCANEPATHHVSRSRRRGTDDQPLVVVEKKEPVSADKNPRIGSPTPIGFFAFGMTTLLYNLHNAEIHPVNMATMGLVVFFGGLTQFVVGWFELINMNTFGCTISTTYGAFWMATAVLYLEPANANVVTFGDHNYTGGFFILWFVFSFTLFLSSFKSPLVCMLLFVSVPINFLLRAAGEFSENKTLSKVSGYEGIWVGALATYIGMATTMADVYGRNILPLFPHVGFRDIKW